MLTKFKRYIREINHPIIGELWCLHRVVPTRSLHKNNRELEITPDYLEELILNKLKKGFRFVTIDDIFNLGMCWLFNKKNVNITFDDGFVDIYTYAFPIFKKYSIPFTIYLTTDFPNKKADIWWIQLEDYENFENNINMIYASGENMRDIMHEKIDSNNRIDLSNDLTLSWQQLTEMLESGLCTIGSHSVSHPSLSRIPLQEAKREIFDSKRIIENKLGIMVNHFSYPHSMKNAEIESLVEKAGYKTATLVAGGPIRKGDNMFNLNRVYITQE